MKKYSTLAMLLIGTMSYTYAESNPFQKFDNNITAGFQEDISNNNYTSNSLVANGQLLFDNNIWLNLNANTELSYSTQNNANQNLAHLFNNAAGSGYSIEGGYAFLVANNWNIIPHVGFSYTNKLLSYNNVQNSTEQFIIRDPGFGWSLGTKLEYLIIPNRLKFATDFNYTYSTHTSVFPSGTNLLAHQGYTSNNIAITPELQWNISNRFTMITYYQFNDKFGGNLNADNVYYPQVGVNSNQIIRNDTTKNIFGVNLGFTF